MRVLGWFVLLGMAWAQTLVVPPEGVLDQALEVRGEGLPPGNYRLELINPSKTGQSFAIQAPQGKFSQTYVPTLVGEYRLLLYLSGKTLTASFMVPEPPIDKTPRLDKDGLTIGTWKLPLSGRWLPPRSLGQRLYLAQEGGLLILEIDPDRPAVVYRHFAPAEIGDLETDPALAVRLTNDRRVALPELPRRPFEGRWESLDSISGYVRHLKDTRSGALDQSPVAMPYWAVLTLDPAQISGADLDAMGRDMMGRGHRPELAWTGEAAKVFEPWLAQVAASRQRGLEASQDWSDFFLRYMPLLPGASRVLGEQAQWFEAQGRSDLSTSYRQALGELAAWRTPWTHSRVGRLALLLGGLYLGMLVYLWFCYLPAQHNNLRSSGGYVMTWLGNPLLRLRHNTLAYTSLGERTVLTLLFLSALLVGLLWAIMGRTEQTANQEAFSRGTLRSYAAQDALRALPSNPSSRGLLAYALAQDNSQDSEQLLAQADPWAYTLVNRATPQALGKALAQSPNYAPAREALGLSGDWWTPVYQAAGVRREGVPTPRLLSLALLGSGLSELGQGFLQSWQRLPLWTANWQAWATLVLLVLLVLYQLMCFVLPRPTGADQFMTWRRGVQFFFPGSPWFKYGWGVVLLALLMLGIEGWRSRDGWGLYLVGLALVLHLVLWAALVGRKRVSRV
jgi:hypothetical protein